MDLNTLPEFEIELDFNPEQDQEKDLGQEKTTDVVTDEGNDDIEDQNDNDDSADEPEYPEGDSLAIQTFTQLKEQGILDDDDENPFNGSWESLEEKMASIPQRVLNTMIQEAPDLTKQLLKFAFSSENITKDDLNTFMKTHLEELNIEDANIETMDDARQYLENTYKERGMRASAIRAALDALEEDDELIDEAKQEYEKNKTAKTAKTDAMIAAKQQETITREKQQLEFMQSLSSELDAMGWTANKMNKVKQTLSNNRLNELLGQIASNPKSLIKLADFVEYYDPKTKDINYTKMTAKNETQSAKSFRDKFEKAINTPNSNTKSTLTNPNSEVDDLIPLVN